MSGQQSDVSGQASAVSDQRRAGDGDLAAFMGAEALLLSGADKDVLLLQMRLYLMNELHELKKMIAWMDGQKAKIEALLAELP